MVEAGTEGALRVAITSSQGRCVDQHFGQARHFLVYEVEPGRSRYLEARPVPEADAEGPSRAAGLDKAVELIADCSLLLTLRAGVHARERLERYGVECMEFEGALLAGLEIARERLKGE